VYAARFTSEALDNVRDLPKNTRNALKKEFQKKILKEPAGCAEELTGQPAGFRSFHFREYRVVYRVYEDLRAIAVVGIGRKHKDASSDIYRRLEDLAHSGKLADSILRTLRLFSSP